MTLSAVQLAFGKGGWFVVSDGQGIAIPGLTSRESIFQLRLETLRNRIRQASTPVSNQALDPLDPQLTPVLGAGVTFSNSLRERRLETFRAGAIVDVSDDGRPTPYDVVYDPINPPEVFFKAIHGGHLAAPDEIWIRPDGAPDGSIGSSVPEPERVLYVNQFGEIFGHSIGSDTTARQLESRSPLYLPAAKTYPGCTTLHPEISLFDPELDVELEMVISRNGVEQYRDRYLSSTSKRSPESLVRHARTLAPSTDGVFDYGFAIFTGTGIIPPVEFSLAEGDHVLIQSPQLGTLSARTHIVRYELD